MEQHSIVFYQTIKTVNLLRDEVQELKLKTNSLRDEVEVLKLESNITQGLLLSNEVATLFIEYIVKPVLLRHLGTSSWDKFTNTLSQFEAQIDDNRLKAIERGVSITYEEEYGPLISYLEPLQTEINLSLTDIRNLRQDRSFLAHHKIKSTKEQLEFLEKAKNFKFSSDFEHKKLVEKMINALEKHAKNFHRLY